MILTKNKARLYSTLKICQDFLFGKLFQGKLTQDFSSIVMEVQCTRYILKTDPEA